MARLSCLCDAGMSNSTVPSENIAEIYTPESIRKAVDETMELIDLWNEDLEFWYCQECKRITVIDRKSWHYLRSYYRIKEQAPLPFKEVSSWRELLFWRDREFYDATEAEWKITVEDFVRKHPSRYLIRLSLDETRALVFSPATHEYLFSYLQDPTPDFVKERGEETDRLLAEKCADKP